MDDVKFSKEHEWIKLEGDIATIGITKHATEMLGDIVFVEIPEIGKDLEKDSQAAVVESTKAASDVYSPISGKVTEVNSLIVSDPSSVNSDPEGISWFFKIKIKDKSDLENLMTKIDYEKFVAENPS
jgi:glycine cleavage system H protein